MKTSEFSNLIRKAIAEHNIQDNKEYPEYSFYGLRFENKKREVGEICERTKHNPDRQDERAFPVYGTDEYAQMPELPGTSAYEIDVYGDGLGRLPNAYALRNNPGSERELSVFGKHAYIIAGDRDVTHSDADYNEIVIQNAVVIEVLF